MSGRNDAFFRQGLLGKWRVLQVLPHFLRAQAPQAKPRRYRSLLLPRGHPTLSYAPVIAGLTKKKPKKAPTRQRSKARNRKIKALAQKASWTGWRSQHYNKQKVSAVLNSRCTVSYPQIYSKLSCFSNAAPERCHTTNRCLCED